MSNTKRAHGTKATGRTTPPKKAAEEAPAMPAGPTNIDGTPMTAKDYKILAYKEEILDLYDKITDLKALVMEFNANQQFAQMMAERGMQPEAEPPKEPPSEE